MGKVTVDAAIGALETWGRSLDTWILVFAVFVAVSLAAEAVVSVMHWQNENKLRPLRAEQSRIHEEELARLNNETAKLTKAATDAKIEQETLEADNLALQTSLRPRRLSFVGWADDLGRVAAIKEGLRKFPGTVAFIQVVPDFEARTFANDIASVLNEVGWMPKFVTESDSHLSEMSFSEGLTIFTLWDGSPHEDAGTALWTAVTEADVLMSGTGTFGASVYREIIDIREPPKSGRPYFTPPTSSVFVRVGLKPFTEKFLNMQRRQMERQNRRMDKVMRDLYDLGGKVVQGVPGHAPIELKPGPDGTMIAANPEEQSLLPKRASPTLVLPGVMLRSSPP